MTNAVLPVFAALLAAGTMSRHPPRPNGTGIDTRLSANLTGMVLNLAPPRLLLENFTAGQYLWFPGGWLLPTGEMLMATAPTADSALLASANTDVWVSSDGGFAYPHTHTIEGLNTAGMTPWRAFGSNLVGGNYAVNYNAGDDINDLRRVFAKNISFSNHGLTYTHNDWSVEIGTFPRGIPVFPDGGPPSATFPLWADWPCDIVILPGGDWLSLIVVWHKDVGFTRDSKATTYAIKSTNGMAGPWTIAGTVATPANGGLEGFVETSLLQLANGDLLALGRTGIGWPRWSLSTDSGATWSAPAVPSVANEVQNLICKVCPRAVLLDNGVLAMVAGRPGLELMLALDGRGTAASSWQQWSIDQYHESWAQIPYNGNSGQAGFIRAKNPTEPFYTTGYTGLVKVGGNTIRVFYDLTPSGHGSIQAGGFPNQIYSLDITVSLA